MVRKGQPFCFGGENTCPSTPGLGMETQNNQPMPMPCLRNRQGLRWALTRPAATVHTRAGYSLIQRLATTRSLVINRVVQAIIQDQLEEHHQRDPWEMITVMVVARLFAGADQRSIIEKTYERSIPQALASVNLIRAQNLAGHAAGHLLFLMGSYLTSHARYEQAEELCQAALQMYQEHFGRCHPETAANLTNLARVYEEQRVHTKALSLFEQPLAVFEQLHPPQHLTTA